MYEVNAVYFDVPQAHLMEAVHAQLDQLNRASESLSEAVRCRINEYRNKMYELQRRINIAQNKIKQVAEMKKAVVIYSPGSYPVPDEVHGRCFKSLISDRTLIPSAELEDKYRFALTEALKIADHLQFFTVKAYDENQLDFYENTPRGLGKMKDRNLKSVADILLFNTSIDPYRDEVESEASSPTREEEAAEFHLGDKFDDASARLPDLGETDIFTDDDDEDDFDVYKPSYSSVPEFPLPPDLPQQDGFISDLPDLLPTSSHASFAPSNLPSFDIPETHPKRRIDLSLNLPDIDSPSPTPPVIEVNPTPVLVTAPPPPPPPPPPPAPIPENSATAGSAVPNPPAPPPAPKAVPASSNDRSSLLDAIRNHEGLKGLKKKSENKVADTPKSKVAASTMSHMDALKERLKKRQTEIGGSDKAPPPDVASPGIEGIMKNIMLKMASATQEESDSASEAENNTGEWE